MASPAWLPQEVQQPASQALTSCSPASTLTSAPPGPDAITVTSGSRVDSSQEAAQAKYVNASGYVVPAPSFSYCVPPNPQSTSGSLQSTSSSGTSNLNPALPPVTVQSPAPGMASSSAPSFSYNISQSGVGFPGIQQFQSSTAVASGHIQGGKSTPSSTSIAEPLQPLVPGQSTHLNSSIPPSSFAPGTGAPLMPLSVPMSNASIYPFSGNSELAQTDQSSKSDISLNVAQGGAASSAVTISQSVPSSFPTSNSKASMSANAGLGLTTAWVLSTPSLSRPPGLSGTSGTPGPPGLVPAFSVADSSTSVLKPVALGSSAMANPVIQQQMYPTYASLPAMAASPQGIWLQPPQMSGMPRPPFLPHPAVYSGPYPLQARALPLTSVPLSDSQAVGVTPVGSAGTMPLPCAAPDHQLAGTPGVQTLQGIDNRKPAQAVGEGGSAVGDQLDAWTAHKTETGIVYYYNAFTGQSTYEKPSGFKGEPHKVPLQPTPVSMEYLSGTDWALVTTNDGKKYYYNSKTKISSWQIPSEVTDLRKKQDIEIAREHLMSVTNSDTGTEKGSALTSLSAPAINTGGRDATVVRTSGTGSSSALDLIKKKLQDAGAPATSSPAPVSSGLTVSETNGSRAIEVTAKGVQSENGKDKVKDATGDANMSDSSSDSEDADSGPTKEECIIQFKEMLKERGVAPFSKWDKELPKIVFDPRFKAIPSHSARRSLFEHYVKTRAEEERKEKRAAQKAAIEGFKQLLDEASEDINHATDYQTFKKKWGGDPRFEALERRDRETLLNERVLPLKRAAEEKAQAVRTAAASSFKSMLQERRDITHNSRWSRVKDSLRNDPRYKSVKHEDREALFNEYISELKAVQEEAQREAKAKREEQEKLKERERELRKRKEREEQEMERVRLKVRRKEAVTSYQALLVETIKDPQASWTESKPKLEKDPQGRATNSNLDPSDTEKLFREHVKMLYERCAHEFKAMLGEIITVEAASKETEDGKTVLNSWSTAKRLLKPDPRYSKMPRKEREPLWRRYVEETLHRQKSGGDQKQEKHTDARSRSSADSGRPSLGSRRHRQR